MMGGALIRCIRWLGVNVQTQMQYKILNDSNLRELENQVNAAMADGWLPCGGVAINEYTHSWENSRKGGTESQEYSCYAQAMTKST